MSSGQDIISNHHLNFYFVYGLKSLNTAQNDEVSLFKITDQSASSSRITNAFGLSYINGHVYVSNANPGVISNST